MNESRYGEARACEWAERSAWKRDGAATRAARRRLRSAVPVFAFRTRHGRTCWVAFPSYAGGRAIILAAAPAGSPSPEILEMAAQVEAEATLRAMGRQ